MRFGPGLAVSAAVLGIPLSPCRGHFLSARPLTPHFPLRVPPISNANSGWQSRRHTPLLVQPTPQTGQNEPRVCHTYIRYKEHLTASQQRTDQVAVVVRAHGVVVVEVQEHHLPGMGVQEAVDVRHAIAHAVSEQPVDEVDFEARLTWLG
ncbi:hypothetical protein JZ751_014981 [Albula glossodonta]|uniref:Uncharacterized protein n=1 Tax=Albula glossodonta TaxID=121402 RepID=A0A8T2MW91_9TELE|nr:hypothetical protein JZ751_014981 [Albula glossodonta]